MSSLLTLAGNAAPTGFYDYSIDQSLRFNDDDNAYLSRTPASAGNRKTWTFSCWVKRGKVSGTDAQILTAYTSASDTTNIIFQSGGAIQWYDYISGYRVHLVTNALYRDVGSWYHLLFQLDTSNATSGDRAKIYVNGERVTSFSTEVYPSLNADLKMNTAIEHRIGDTAQFAREFDGYMADVNFIDGQALEPTSFGEFKSGIWIPKDTADLTFGTNGFRLQFNDTTEASGFNTVTWTGDNTNGGNAVGGVGFSPDMVWAKSRSDAYSGLIYDSIRGTGATAELKTDGTEAEGGSSSSERGYLNSFDADGFSSVVGSNGDNLYFNQSGRNYVAWCWDAGSGSAASNTDGSITSTVKANTDYGFSIVSYTGTGSNATVGHGLGVAPQLYIVKYRNAAGDWKVYSEDVGNTYQGFLNDTSAFQNTGATIWNNTSPTSSVFSIGTNGGVNTNGGNYIAYCFAEKTNYSSISSYTGNGSTSGPTITTGFRPAFVMIKRTDSANSWTIQDNTRDTSNPIDLYLLADDSGAEGSSGLSVDFLSNGFQIKTTSAAVNASGGTYIFMAFADTRDAAFWKDVSGEGNDWQPNNLTFSDVVPDSATNNFAVLNNLETNDSGATYTEGNLVLQTQSAGSNVGVASFSIPKSSKWYWEVNVLSTSGTIGDNARIGLQVGNNITPSLDVRYKSNGDKSVNNASSAYGASYTAGDIIGVAVDADSNTVEFYKNGSSQGSISYTMDADSDYFPVLPEASGTINIKFAINFGQDSTFSNNTAAGGNVDANGYGDFKYTVPSGYLSLCSANLPTGAINTLSDETPEDYFNTVLYSGNSTNNTPITVGFEPSMTWIKTRNVVRDHRLMDAVRGATAGVYPNLTNAEGGSPLISFDTDGFTLNNTNNYNNSGETYVSWNWKANGAGVSNTDGSITSTVSVGATSQQNWFSVVSYTGNGSAGASVGHGLGRKPDILFYKNRDDGTQSWVVYTDVTGTNGFLILNSTAAFADASAVVSAPNSSTFNLHSFTSNNGSGDGIICYAFANAEGLCKVGTYTGNGSTDGPMIVTGHRPAWVMVKKTSDVGQWRILDATRNLFNITDLSLGADRSDAEQDMNDGLDFTANGFKVRTTRADYNTSGGTYIYLSIASQPFRFANAR